MYYWWRFFFRSKVTRFFTSFHVRQQTLVTSVEVFSSLLFQSIIGSFLRRMKYEHVQSIFIIIDSKTTKPTLPSSHRNFHFSSYECNTNYEYTLFTWLQFNDSSSKTIKVLTIDSLCFFMHMQISNVRKNFSLSHSCELDQIFVFWAKAHCIVLQIYIS